jgi:hypothetical protein
MPNMAHDRRTCKRQGPSSTAEDSFPPIEGTQADLEAIAALGLTNWLDWPPAADEVVR